MKLHKLSAGAGYTYLSRQVAANDADEHSLGDLGSYYTESGEAPGRWVGRGLASVPQFDPRRPVSEAQMRALFGAGRHPDAERIEAQMRSGSASETDIERGTRLGSPYRVFARPTEFNRRCSAAFRRHGRIRRLPSPACVPAQERARLRTELASTMFTEHHGRPPADSRELTGHLA